MSTIAEVSLPVERTARRRTTGRIRRALFWVHLCMGVTASAVILLLCLTGALLAFQRQILRTIDEWQMGRRAASFSSATLPTNQAIARARSSATPLALSSITVWSEPSRPMLLEFANQHALYADNSTGEVLGEGSQSARQFFHEVTELHRWLGMQGSHRELGRALTGLGTLVLLALICSGVFLWLPKRWWWPAIKGALLFRPGLHGKAREWNWHNVVAIWSVIPLFIIVLSGTVMSYQWANNLVYRITGSTPPAARQTPSAPGERAHGGNRSNATRDPDRTTRDVDIAALLASAQHQVPAWRSITLRLGDASGPITAFVLTGPEGRPDARQQLTLDRASAAVIRAEGFATYNAGRRLRAWLRFAHTGEALGIVGQTIATLATLGASLLVYTGVALALRRLLATLSKRRATLGGTVINAKEIDTTWAS